MKSNDSININIIIKVIYKNIILILFTMFMVVTSTIIYTVVNKSFKSTIILYGNERVLNEIGENPQYSLNSFDFFEYIYNKSKKLNKKNLSIEKFLNEISNRLVAQTETGNPTIKVKFTTNNKVEGEEFSKEYVTLVQNYLDYKEEIFLQKQIKLLEEEYNIIKNNIDIRTSKDPLIDTLVSRLSYYKLLKNDTSPNLKLVSISTKSSINKKITYIISVCLGLFLGVLIAFLREFFNISENFEN